MNKRSRNSFDKPSITRNIKKKNIYNNKDNPLAGFESPPIICISYARFLFPHSFGVQFYYIQEKKTAIVRGGEESHDNIVVV